MHQLYALDFSLRKRPFLRTCFPHAELRFVSHLHQVPDAACLLVWGMRFHPMAEERGISVLRVEDGFLRSVGLGADLTRPLSWVVDRRGMHYDASRPSDLEVLLSANTFAPPLLQRAAALRQRIVAGGVTKYNVGGLLWRRPAQLGRVILVPGQVQSDASIRFGSPLIQSNLALLQAVRAENPQAYVLYKPHPDVLAGLRRPGRDDSLAVHWCDQVLGDVPMGPLLEEVDEVHCLTSLTGFEALLRELRVSCYGQPFYAGWGLTTDRVPLGRRQRRLSLDELVAGALILYPRYMSRWSPRLISPELALDELLAWRARSGGLSPWWRQTARALLRRFVRMD